jgi:hypothetical protein
MKYNDMDFKQRSAYLAGGRVTAREQFSFGATVKGGWVPRIRGLQIGQQMFDTEEEAIDHGRKFQAKCKATAEGQHE